MIGPAVRVSDIIVPELFTSSVIQETVFKTRIIGSGIAERDSSMDAQLDGGGLTFNSPSWQQLENDPDRISTDTSVPFAGPYNSSGATVTLPAGQAFPPDPHKIKQVVERYVRLSRNNSWSTTALAKALSGEDPLAVIQSMVSEYWRKRLQEAFVSSMKGVISYDLSNENELTNDISGTSYSAGVTDFNAASFIDTATMMGDSMEDLTGVLVHSMVYARLLKNDLIEFLRDSEGTTRVPTFLGREVIVDDSMPRTGNLYDTWMFGSGFSRIGISSPDVPTEVDRKPGAGNGAGQEVLYNRTEWGIHPSGFSFVGTNFGDGGPANSGSAGDDLDEGTSWGRVFTDRKQIKFARLVTREA